MPQVEGFVEPRLGVDRVAGVEAGTCRGGQPFEPPGVDDVGIDDERVPGFVGVHMAVTERES